MSGHIWGMYPKLANTPGFFIPGPSNRAGHVSPRDQALKEGHNFLRRLIFGIRHSNIQRCLTGVSTLLRFKDLQRDIFTKIKFVEPFLNFSIDDSL
jgi:hypothetical protein